MPNHGHTAVVRNKSYRFVNTALQGLSRIEGCKRFRMLQTIVGLLLDALMFLRLCLRRLP